MLRLFAALAALLILIPASARAQDAEAARPLVLLTNDDGYQSPDLIALAAALDDRFDVLITAPGGNQSGTSTAISGIGREMDWSEFDVAAAGLDADHVEGFWLDATPSLTVHWGVALAERLYGRRPDIVLSGMNSGSNDGDAHHYSGTVGAARTAQLLGLSSMAISLHRGEERDPQAAAQWTAFFTERVLEAGEPVYLNINIPAWPHGGIDTGLPVPAALPLVAFDRNGEAPMEAGEDGLRSGVVVFGLGREGEPAPDSDMALTEMGVITIVPLRLEGFDAEALDHLGALLANGG